MAIIPIIHFLLICLLGLLFLLAPPPLRHFFALLSAAVLCSVYFSLIAGCQCVRALVVLLLLFSLFTLARLLLFLLLFLSSRSFFARSSALLFSTQIQYYVHL